VCVFVCVCVCVCVCARAGFRTCVCAYLNSTCRFNLHDTEPIRLLQDGKRNTTRPPSLVCGMWLSRNSFLTANMATAYLTQFWWSHPVLRILTDAPCLLINKDLQAAIRLPAFRIPQICSCADMQHICNKSLKKSASNKNHLSGQLRMSPAS